MDIARETINKALAEFKAATGLTLKRAEATPRATTELLVTFEKNGTKRMFAAQFKKHLNQQIFGATAHALRNLPHKGLLIADYVNPEIAERLKQMNIPFLDAVGNAFLDEPPIYVYITGKKPRQKIAPTHGQPFHAAGLRVVFLLLCQPELINRTYREIAKYAGVALGTVAKVLEDLKARRNLINLGNNKQKLVNTKQLLQEWVLLYPTTLRPRLMIGRYTADTQDWWNNAKLPPNALWAGEIAAARLTKYLKPALATIYTHGKGAEVVVKNHLREDDNGKIEILRAFWDPRLELNKKGMVPPLLVYADLLATGDPRNIQTAELLYEKELARFIDQN